MWTYYGAFYVQQYGFRTDQVGLVHSLPGWVSSCGQTAAGGRLGRAHAAFYRRSVGAGSLMGCADAAAARCCRIALHGGRLAHARHGLVSTVELFRRSIASGRAVTLPSMGPQ